MTIKKIEWDNFNLEKSHDKLQNTMQIYFLSKN